jgi:hypothetical protein
MIDLSGLVRPGKEAIVREIVINEIVEEIANKLKAAAKEQVEPATQAD